MKKVLILLGLCCLGTIAWAQLDRGAKVVTRSGAVQYEEDIGAGNIKFVLQVGVPYMGLPHPTSDTASVCFPWGTRYSYETFSHDAFDVSKGIYGDKIRIQWTIKKNDNLITSYTISRRRYDPPSSGNWNVIISGSSDRFYEDKYVEGGVLYEYKVYAVGVIGGSTEILLQNYIIGRGFRNPRAIVTGSVSFEGGNPVKDVTVLAKADGGVTDVGSALHVPDSGKVRINLMEDIPRETTLQAWLKPYAPYQSGDSDAIRLFQLQTSEGGKQTQIDVGARLLKFDSVLEVTIDGKVYELQNYYPSGQTNARGDDELVPVSDFNSNFVHFTVILKNGEIPTLFINGRPICQDYRDEAHSKLSASDTAYTRPYFAVVVPTGGTFIRSQIDYVHCGGDRGAILDEIRIWKRAIDTSKIRSDYRRYISANNADLLAYLSANEGTGDKAYDFAHQGFDYKVHHGALEQCQWVSGAGNVPAAHQLGIMGITDENGNFQIAAIPYSGTGESFTITPMYGQHQFEPSQQLVYLGVGSEVVNQLDFVDKSSFSFKGQVVYDTRGVFPAHDTSAIKGPVIGTGYNYYETLGGKYDKGKYWKNTDENLDDFPDIGSEGVNIYIDGNIALDANNMPIASDEAGYFDLSVPIGNHYISVKKDGHTFAYGGRYPAGSGEVKEFFENSDRVLVFIDSTRVTMVGRVVGGPVEAEKVIGFGEDGLYEHPFDDSSDNGPKTVVSSKNNIGVAEIMLKYGKDGLTCLFHTDSASGEYRVNLLPLRYELSEGDIKIPTWEEHISAPLPPTSTKTIDVREIRALTIPEFAVGDTTLYGVPYHYENSFIYRSTPELNVIKQTSDQALEFGGLQKDIDRFDTLIYTQFTPGYEIELRSYELYTSYDTGSGVNDTVPVTDAALNITNNLALPGSEAITQRADTITYTFTGGMPSISKPFTRTISIEYLVNGVPYAANNLKSAGIILGGQEDGTETFITAAPDMPDIILRDPPGSNSFASIEEGTSISFTTEHSFALSGEASISRKVMLGAEFSAGGGIAGPVIKTERISNIELGFRGTWSSKDGKSLTKTYSFSQSISTSDDPNWVGADADLYIGNSKNYRYGTYDNVRADTVIVDPDDDYYRMGISDTDTIFISKQKGFSMVEEPSETSPTFFVYTQRHILETLIPELELIISDIDKGLLTEEKDSVETRDHYVQQIRLWKAVILENEKSKYLAKYMRKRYKQSLDNTIDNFMDQITDSISEFRSIYQRENLKKKLDQSKQIKDLLD